MNLHEYFGIEDYRFLNNFKNVRAGFSLRKINKDNSLAVRVRKIPSSDEQDFTVKEITDGTLTDWVGVGNDGFVVKFYGQKNSYDGTQSTASRQPKIVDSGSLILHNGKPTIDFDGSDDTFSIGVGTAPTQMDLFFVAKMNAFTNNGRVFAFGTSNTSNLGSVLNPVSLLWNFSVFFRTTGEPFRYNWLMPENTAGIFNLVVDFTNIDATCKLFLNGSELTRTVGGDPPTGTFVTPSGNFLNLAGPTVFNNINFKEVVLFDTIQSAAERNAIFSSLNQYYNEY